KLSESVSLKTDVRHLINFEGDHNLLYTLGLGISFGEKAKAIPVKKEIIKEEILIEEIVKEEPIVLDDDKDGVINSKDKCPTTPRGARVNKYGCELDDDKDGVVNSKDKCPDTITGAIVDNTGCAVTVNLHINFDTDSSIIKNTYENKIEEFVSFLKKYPSVKAKIEAHTDATGSQNYNKKLSQRRANSAVKALLDLDIDESRLEAIGYGELKPIKSNKTKEGRASNRRVEAVIKK
ncbi:MAG: OmpA family protein, partial [Campylobacteraceae bacterium]|nr:OmpA family protein [Campylobacteraceae bacterium]